MDNYTYILIGDVLKTIKPYFYVSFFVVFLFSFFIYTTSALTIDNSLPLLHKVIFVDPGHGGRDSGTTYGRILEKNLNLEISRVLRDELSRQGAIVYMIREDDSDLSSKYDIRKKRGDLYRRILMISDKEKDTDLYLSIHINWYDNSYWKGAEVLYNDINPKNKILGQILMKNFSEDLSTKRTLKETNLYMYDNISIPGVLIECGFLSNPVERNLLQSKDYYNRISKSITKSVIEYFSLSY